MFGFQQIAILAWEAALSAFYKLEQVNELRFESMTIVTERHNSETQ